MKNRQQKTVAMMQPDAIASSKFHVGDALKQATNSNQQLLEAVLSSNEQLGMLRKKLAKKREQEKDRHRLIMLTISCSFLSSIILLASTLIYRF